MIERKKTSRIRELQLPRIGFGRGKLKRIIFMTGIVCLSVMVTFAQAVPTKAPASGIATAAPANATAIDETKLTISETPPNQTPGSNGGSFGVWDLVRMLIILGLVVAAIYGVFHVIKRGSKPKSSSSGSPLFGEEE